MLKNDFYSCQEWQANDSEITARLTFNPDHAIFSGHFPGNPVVPGVCMMEIVKELLQEQVNHPLKLRTSGNVKFLQIITPLLQPVMKIAWKENEKGYVVKASIMLEDAAMFKFEGVFEAVTTVVRG